MEVHTIKTEKDYNNAMNIIDNLIDSPVGSEGAEKLELLSILVEDYENKHYKIETPERWYQSIGQFSSLIKDKFCL